MKILRSVLGIVLGLIIGGIVITGVQMVNILIHPVPAGLDPANPDDLKLVLTHLPVTALIGLLLSYLFGVFFAAFAAAKVAGRSEVLHGFIISLIFAFAGIRNFNAISAPTWVVIAAFVIFFGAGFMGSSFAGSLRKAKA
jgi:hypothetical protein